MLISFTIINNWQKNTHMKAGGSFFIVDPRISNRTINETKIRVTSKFDPLEIATVTVTTQTYKVHIQGPSCYSCCDQFCDHSTLKYSRATLSNVFNKLRKDGILPDPLKILDLLYINRYSSVDDEAESEENSDYWWYHYIKENYKMVNFTSCTLFDEKKDYSLYK